MNNEIRQLLERALARAKLSIHTKDATLADNIEATLAKPVQEPTFVWRKIADYEKEIGGVVNQVFRMGWDMARTTDATIAALLTPKKL
jgi:hypothetical protein